MHVLHFYWYKFIILIHIIIAISLRTQAPTYNFTTILLLQRIHSNRQKYAYSYVGLHKCLYVCYLKLQVHLCKKSFLMNPLLVFF